MADNQNEFISTVFKTSVWLDKVIDSDSVEKYQEVKIAEFYGHCDMARISFPRGVSLYFPKLVKLFIIGQDIEKISREDLKGLENLETLCIERCGLKYLFQDMNDLEEISFNGNELEYVSSDLLLPIIKNDLKFVKFQGNKRIDAFFNKKRTVAGISILGLMAKIDAMCLEPLDDGFFIKNFTAKFSRKFTELWESGRGSDFKVKLRDLTEINIHKFVLITSMDTYFFLFDV